MDLLIVGMGGAIGSSLRFGLSTIMARALPRGRIPVSTLAINVVGSFALGILLGALFSQVPSSSELQERPLALLIGVGVCGAFTTFSAFSMEMTQLLKARAHTGAALYLAATVAGCTGALLAGIVLGR